MKNETAILLELAIDRVKRLMADEQRNPEEFLGALDVLGTAACRAKMQVHDARIKELGL